MAAQILSLSTVAWLSWERDDSADVSWKQILQVDLSHGYLHRGSITCGTPQPSQVKSGNQSAMGVDKPIARQVAIAKTPVSWAEVKTKDPVRLQFCQRMELYAESFIIFQCVGVTSWSSRESMLLVPDV